MIGSEFMDSRIFKFALPATLAVSTFVSANACRNELHCVDIEKQKKCEAEESCRWNSEYGWCESLCGTLESQSECEAIENCFWEPGGGSGGESGESGETGEITGTCHEPFT